MARGRFRTVSSSVSTNTDTTLVAAPGEGQRVYVLYVSVDATTAGTASTVAMKDGTTPFATFDTTAVGHKEARYVTGCKEYPGFALSENAALVMTTAGTAAATLRATVIYEIK